MFIHHVNDIDWLVITAFEELKTMFIEEAGAIPSYFSTTSELSLIDQAKRSYGYLPTLSGEITDSLSVVALLRLALESLPPLEFSKQDGANSN